MAIVSDGDLNTRLKSMLKNYWLKKLRKTVISRVRKNQKHKHLSTPFECEGKKGRLLIAKTF